jgi:hypothetical protein
MSDLACRRRLAVAIGHGRTTRPLPRLHARRVSVSARVPPWRPRLRASLSNERHFDLARPRTKGISWRHHRFEPPRAVPRATSHRTVDEHRIMRVWRACRPAECATHRPRARIFLLLFEPAHLVDTAAAHRRGGAPDRRLTFPASPSRVLGAVASTVRARRVLAAKGKRRLLKNYSFDRAFFSAAAAKHRCDGTRSRPFTSHADSRRLTWSHSRAVALRGRPSAAKRGK